MVLCLCTKNELNSVEDVFQHNREMILSLDDVATLRINWEPKSSNLKSLAKELNLGLDSFILLDDSEAECKEVRGIFAGRDVAEFEDRQNLCR